MVFSLVGGARRDLQVVIADGKVNFLKRREVASYQGCPLLRPIYIEFTHTFYCLIGASRIMLSLLCLPIEASSL